MCIYNKALQLSTGITGTTDPDNRLDKEDSTEHDEAVNMNIDLGNIVNLAAEDTNNIREFIWNVHYIWALPLKMTIIFGLVYTRLGISAAIGSVLGTVIIIPLQVIIGKAMSDNNKKILETEDKRLQLSAEALQSMKTVKLNCWEEFIQKRIQDERDKELRCLRRDSFYWSVMAFLAGISTLLVTTITIGIFIGIEEESFTAANLFTAMALFNQLTVCLSVFPVTIPIFIKGVVSKKRILQFFSRPESYGTCIALDKNDHLEEDKKLDQDNDEDPSTEKSAKKFICGLTDASFRWTDSSPDTLHSLNMTIPEGVLTVVVGRSGSGKSSLLAAVLKEMQQTGGTREFDTEEKYSKYAVLPQNPWLMNASIRDNILFGRPYKVKRYMKTVRACDLHMDIDKQA